MKSAGPSSSVKPLLSLSITEEVDIVTARQRCRQVAAALGFSQQDQARLATAVSEVVRNAFQYGRQGKAGFSFDVTARPQLFWVAVTDQGPGMADVDAVLSENYKSPTGMGIGLAGTRRLMDRFEIESVVGQGTTVRFAKALPPTGKHLQASDLGRIFSVLVNQRPAGAFEELQSQNRELLQTLQLLRAREVELERRQAELARLNLELEETNRGVVALYAELDEKAAAIRRADDMKSRFLSHVSHEFRTPVNSVLALTQILLQRVDGELTLEQEKQVGYIRRAARELADMVNDLLDLAKVEAGKTDLRIDRVELSPLFGAIRALMRPLATNEAVSLVFDEPAPGLSLQTDESKLGQILRNLVSNALKFTEKGEVRVCAAQLEDGQRMYFSVKDTGIGIASEHLEKIFQEFSQVDSPIQRQVKGTGLGLPLSRKLAALLGGTLSVSSLHGAGSNFELVLPLGANPQAEPPALQEPPPEPAEGTILIIDDEEASRYLTRHLLRGTKYKILESADPDEGAERARFEKPSMVILDLVMPDRTGFEVLEELKSDNSTRDIPVVVQTSKLLTPADYDRLSARQITILPKGGAGRRDAFLIIRQALGEPNLFMEEPEFSA